MVKCDMCKYLKQRINGRKVLCKQKGFVNQRINECNEYIEKPLQKYDALAWTGVQ